MDTGIVFKRVDRGGYEIPAKVEHVSGISHATCLARGETRIETVEHLLAALFVCGVDNAIVELDTAEVPIMDGSAAPFLHLVQEVGLRELPAPRFFIRLLRPISVEHEGRLAAVYPSDTLRVTYAIQFRHRLVGNQEYSIAVDVPSFMKKIAPARTFGFLKDVEVLRRNGLALGGSLDNSLVLSETGVLGNALRFPDEFVRHKIIDVLGDLALLNRPLLAHVVAMRAGHALHTELSQTILSSPDSWELVTKEGAGGVLIPAIETHVPSFVPS